jgi:putative flippase GtrA
MDKPETQAAVLKQDTEWKNQRNNRMCLWFVPFVSSFNTACVSGLSILCLVSKLPVSWFVSSVSYPNAACDSGLVLRKNTEWTNQ